MLLRVLAFTLRCAFTAKYGQEIYTEIRCLFYAHIGQSNARKPTTMGGPILSLKLLQALNDRDLKRVRECTKDK